jgi:hypothetical protein
MGNENLIRISHLAIIDSNHNDKFDAGDQMYWIRSNKGQSESIRLDQKAKGFELAQVELSRLGITTPLSQISSLRGAERFAGSYLKVLSRLQQTGSLEEIKPELQMAFGAAQAAGLQIDRHQVGGLLQAALRLNSYHNMLKDLK